MVHRGSLGAVLAAVLLIGGAAAPARATTCTTVPAYPGDLASQSAIAAWMATGATAAGLPGELPVMGALVESGLKNLDYGDRDAVGFFAMRTGIWDNGRYAGFPTNPPLQLLWFTDHATAAGAQRAAMGIDNSDPGTWGEWDADVLQPAAEFRGRYQLRLGEAQALILAGCPAPPPGSTPPSPPASPQPPSPPQPPAPPRPADTVAPRIALGGSSRQSARARAVTVRVRCVTEACRVKASGIATIGGSKRRLKLGGASASAGARQGVVLRLRLPLAARRALRSGKTVQTTIIVTARDAAANTTVRRWSVRLGP
jgi:hypothetical protein